jgi:Flp pilus assembly protein TadD
MTAIAPLCYRRGVSVDLDEAKAAFEAGRIDEAEALLRAAGPAGSAKAAADLGGVCVHKGQLAEGVRHLLKALELSPGWMLPRYNLALALLAQGAYELGWMLLEARRSPPRRPSSRSPSGGARTRRAGGSW